VRPGSTTAVAARVGPETGSSRSAGPCGEAVATELAGAGLSLAVVEEHLVGGECPYWGCIPSKTLIRPGDVLAAVRRAPGAAKAVTGRLAPAAAFAQRDYMTYHGRIAAAAILGGGVAEMASEGIVPPGGFPRPTGVRGRSHRRPSAGRRAEHRRGQHPDRRGSRRLHPGQRHPRYQAPSDRQRSQGGGGRTFTGPGLRELLHSATVTICGGVTVDRLWHAVPSFPTVSEVWLHLLEAYGL